MSERIVRLLPTSAATVGNDEMARKLRAFADAVEAGEWGTCRTVITCIEAVMSDGTTRVSRHTLCPVESDLARTVGVLTWAVHDIIHN